MKLGINQIYLLYRCLKKGSINSYDVKVVYGFSTSRRHATTSQNKTLTILEKLELRNLISRIPDKIPWCWQLTDKGKKVLIEHLPKSTNQRRAG